MDRTDVTPREQSRIMEETMRIPCECGDASCVLCDDEGRRDIDLTDVIRLRRHALNTGHMDVVRWCDRALSDAEDVIAWHRCAEVLS